MIKKESQNPPWWPKIESGLRGMSNLPANIRDLLAAGKIIYDSTPPSGVAPNAKAFVTTEDVDDDGKLDSVHMVITNIEKEIPPDILSKINQMELSDPALQSVLTNIAKTLIHEVAHLEDYSPEHGFPGGEAIAESKERSFEPVFAETTTNKKIGIDNNVEITSVGDYKMKKELVNLANHLDKLGHKDLADKLDGILKEALPLTREQREALPILEDEHGNLIPNTRSQAEEMGLDPKALSGWRQGVKLEGLDRVKNYLSGGRTAEREAALPDLQDVDNEDAIEETEETAVEAGDEANDFEIEAMSAQDRINKMAELMAGEFTVNVPEHYRKY